MLDFEDYLFEAKTHLLSGVVLIADNKILLVRPKKFRKKIRKFSIPKGHIESKVSNIKTALHELEEESTIKLKPKHLKKADKISINYEKAGFKKKLTCYIVKISKEELKVPLVNDMILRYFLKNEIVKNCILIV